MQPDETANEALGALGRQPAWIPGKQNRLSLFKLLGVSELPFDPAPLESYARESQPIIADGPDVLLLERLVKLLELSQAALAERMAALRPEELEQQIALFGNRPQSLGEWLMFFFFHAAYHTGQTELPRQAAGKDDKVI